MANLLANLFSRVRLQSIRQRYLFVFITLSFIMLLVTYVGWRYVDLVSHNQLKDIQHRTEASDALADLVSQIHTIQISLQRFITMPTEANNRSIDRAFQLYDAAIITLRKNAWVKQDAALLELVYALGKDEENLNNEVQKLVNVRLDKSQWFPAMNIMQERMLNNNMQFKTALEFMIQEASEDLKSAKKIELYKVLNEIRYTWQLMISEFRLFVSNSFGIFSNNPQLGMQSRKMNIELYIKRLDTLIKQLDRYKPSKKQDTVSNGTLADLRNSHRQWTQAYAEVLQSFTNEQWRHDLMMLRENVEPLLARIKQRTSSLQLELAVANSKNITLLTRLAMNLSDYVIVFALSVIALGVVGYIVFQRAILSPITTFAHMLKFEAVDQSTDKSKILQSTTAEFRQLTDAFNEMRQQVNTRQAHLDHMAHHDALTQLPNRILLRDRLSQSIARAKRDEKMVGLMFLDLDRFKQINDSLGHDIGDKLLQVVAERLTSCVRATDTVSRLGGDEFAVVVESVTHAEQIAAMARKILAAFIPPFRVEQHELHSSASIGIALGPNDDNDVDALIKDADIAMYHAKDLGRGNFKFYSAEMASQVAEHMALETQLRHALNHEELHLYYQPIVDIKSGNIISTEALLRWHHPERGVITPDDFLSIMEDSGLIRPITQWVLYEASKQYLKHKQAGYPNIRMSVNLSGLLLKGDTILDLVINAIEHTQMDPNGLTVEITEDTLVEDLHGSDQALRTLKEMGIRVALDDFGTGQSSLSHLRLTPIDIVKIDRDFIRDIPDDQNDCELVDAVIAMAHKLRMSVVAEGVESKAQLDFLAWHKCDSVQGYYYSRPLESEAILALISQHKKIGMA